jgi:probable O-glycosylation ligase (exosortase A-associated)
MLYFGLLASFVLEYLRPGTYLPFITVLHVNTIVPVSIFVFSLFGKLSNSNGDVLRHRNSRWLTAFLFLLLIGPLHVDVKHYAIDALTVVLGYLMMAFAVAKLIDEPNKLKGLVLTLVLCHAVLVVLNPGVITDSETRHYIMGVTFLGDGNDFAMSASLLVPLCLYLFLDSTKKWARLAYLAITVLMVLGIVGTSSRGAVLALSAFAIYMWWRSRRKALGLIVVAIGVVGVLFFASGLFFERMGTLSNYEEEGSAMARITTWTAATRMANDHPLLGVGASHFRVKFGVEYRPQDVEGPMPWLNAHSIFFQMLGEFGYTGIVILLGSLLYCFSTGERILMQVRRSSSELAKSYEVTFYCLNASLVAFAVGAAFLSALYYPHWYVMMALYTAAELMYRRDEPRIFAETAPGTTRPPELANPAV